MPDVSVFLLTLAGLAYLIPGTVKKLEESKALRITLAFVFLIFATLAVVLNEADRIENERQQREFSGTLKTVASQNGEILTEALANKDVPEVERRKRILALLRNEYVLSHSSVSAGILSGEEPPPADWTNQRLKDLGESWTVAEEIKTVPKPAQRSYLAFDGDPKFTGTSASNTEGVEFKPGDPLGFNVHFKATGPNSIQSGGEAFEGLLEPDFNPDTQKRIVGEFLTRLKEEEKRLSKPAAPPATMTPGDAVFDTAYVWTNMREHRIAVQQDLDDLHGGKLIAFVISLITYKDAGVTHHLRRCEFLQPPAAVNAIWHFCQLFNNSD